MMQNTICRWAKGLLLGAMLLPGFARAQQFQCSLYGDTLLGFRKPGVDSYEVVVNIGNVTNFEDLAVGTTVTISNYTTAQLLTAFPDGLSNLSWSVSSTFKGLAAWNGFQSTTLWYSSARSNLNTQSVPISRGSQSAQAPITQIMLGMDGGAGSISTNLGPPNANNSAYYVREPVWNGVDQVRYDYTWWVTDENYSHSPYNGFGLNTTAENITPVVFSSASRSDFYRSRPTNFKDPETGLTSGNALYLGYFTFNPDGSMTFTRQSATTTSSPPPPPVLSVTRAGNVSTVTFMSTNNATYTLYYSAAVNMPFSSWSSLPGTLTGTGSGMSFSDTNSAPIRFYRVSAH